MNPRLKALADAGISIWLDDLSRARITSGNLEELMENSSVVGVTTNPTIFAAALSKGADYAEQLRELGNISLDEAITTLTTTDVRNACDLMANIYAETGGFDGRVSIEVEPTIAHDTDATVAQAIELHDLVDRENVLIKIPATKAGLPAITDTIAAGVSVNVTLIFSSQRYREVAEAYIEGLEKAAAAGLDLAKIHSVASVFVSRVDTEVDARLEAAGHPELNGKAGIANSQVTFAEYEDIFGSERFAALAAKGANRQRPLWASTGTKNPAYSDTLYVSELIAPGCVNTMPEKTMNAYADHGEPGLPLPGTGGVGQATLDTITAAGVDLTDVFQTLEDEAVEKFIASWHELIESVRQAMEAVS